MALAAVGRFLHAEGFGAVMARPAGLALIHVCHLEGASLPLRHLEDLRMAVGALQILGNVLLMAEDNLALTTPPELEIRGTLHLSPSLLHHDRAEERDHSQHNRED